MYVHMDSISMNLFTKKTSEMAESMPPSDINHDVTRKIATFAVLDLETNDFPCPITNRVSITELSIHAFDTTALQSSANWNGTAQESLGQPLEGQKLPFPPRALHKLNLLFRPDLVICPEVEKLTGLNNTLLERESRLDENAAQMIINFLKHLRAPVCLVAHNGWFFDFPIVKQAFNMLNMQLPSSILCVDSLRAFLEIDDKCTEEILKGHKTEPFPAEKSMTKLSDTTNCQAVNEISPHRLIKSNANGIVPHRQSIDVVTPPATEAAFCPVRLWARRQLFSGLNCAQTKRCPPKGRYALSSLYTRTFQQQARNAHQAEADVINLTQLIQWYGIDFLAFAEEQSIPFSKVIPLRARP